jgi:hypothetical protein
MPDALICYPGSIEKLKLLGATYLLTVESAVDGQTMMRVHVKNAALRAA